MHEGGERKYEASLEGRWSARWARRLAQKELKKVCLQCLDTDTLQICLGSGCNTNPLTYQLEAMGRLSPAFQRQYFLLLRLMD